MAVVTGDEQDTVVYRSPRHAAGRARNPRNDRRWFVLAAVGVLLMTWAGVTWATVPAGPDDAATLRQICEAAQRGQLSSADRTWAQRCARVAGVAGGQLATPSPSPSSSPTGSPSPTSSPSPTPSPTSSPTPSPTPSPTASPTPSPSPTAPPPGGWPGPANTGIPDGTILSTYTGPCTVTVANTVIDAKQINCLLQVRAPGVVVTRSQLIGINGDGFRVEDSTINATPTSDQGAIADGINGDNFTAIRVDVSGSNRGVYCHLGGTIRDSWVHGTEIDPTSSWHASAVRMEQGCTIVHNTLACDWLIPTPSDGGCSADLTGYPDFAPIKDNLIQNNLFVANPTGAAFCAYGGGTPGKPYSNDPTNATNIRFIDNVFQVGPDPARGECADYGPIDSFMVGRPGNVWQNNLFDDGRVVVP